MAISLPRRKKVLLMIRLSPMAESSLYKIAHCNQSVLRRVGQRCDFSRLGTPASHRVEPVAYRCTARASGFNIHRAQGGPGAGNSASGFWSGPDSPHLTHLRRHRSARAMSVGGISRLGVLAVRVGYGVIAVRTTCPAR